MIILPMLVSNDHESPCVLDHICICIAHRNICEWVNLREERFSWTQVWWLESLKDRKVLEDLQPGQQKH